MNFSKEKDSGRVVMFLNGSQQFIYTEIRGPYYNNKIHLEIQDYDPQFDLCCLVPVFGRS